MFQHQMLMGLNAYNGINAVLNPPAGLPAGSGQIIYNFNEGAGNTVNDDSGNNLHGTLIQTGATWTTGTNKSYAFNAGLGTNGYVRVPLSAIWYPTTKFTVHMVRRNNPENTPIKALVNYSDGGSAPIQIREVYVSDTLKSINLFMSQSPSLYGLFTAPNVTIPVNGYNAISISMDMDTDTLLFLFNNVQYTMTPNGGYPLPTLASFTSLANITGTNEHLCIGQDINGGTANPFAKPGGVIENFAFKNTSSTLVELQAVHTAMGF